MTGGAYRPTGKRCVSIVLRSDDGRPAAACHRPNRRGPRPSTHAAYQGRGLVVLGEAVFVINGPWSVRGGCLAVEERRGPVGRARRRVGERRGVDRRGHFADRGNLVDQRRQLL